MPLHVNAADLETILQIFDKELPNVEIQAFGSRVAKTEPNPEAGLDLAIVAGHIISLERMITIERSLAESGLPFAVDVFDFAKLTSEFKGIIEKENVVLREAAK